jgi:uncharacterized protein YjaG (DUF416 family)
LFNEAELVQKLDELVPRARVAFAAACAERMLPAYVAFSTRANRGDAPALAEMLERVWNDLLGDRIEIRQLQTCVERCAALIPGEDEEPWLEDQPYADDAASAVAYTLRALERGEPRESAWAARRAYEALDHHVTHRLGIDDEDQAASHVLVQAELQRQARDLEDLRVAGEKPADAIVRLRDRARVEAPTFFGP